MRRFPMITGVVVVVAGLVSAPSAPLHGQGDNGAWTTVQGRITWKGEVPARPPIAAANMILACKGRGVVIAEEVVVNPKNQGLANVVVWIAPLQEGDKLPVHPALKNLPAKQVAIDQPCCMFEPRVVGLREGDELVVKNSAAITHNVRWTGNPDNNKDGNVNLPAGAKHVIKDLKVQKLPLMVECNIHPWMRGRVAVFDHPYFAVTDTDGKFELPMAPNGKYKLYVYHELGWRGGKAGRDGEPITIQGGKVMQLGDLVYNTKK